MDPYKRNEKFRFPTTKYEKYVFVISYLKRKRHFRFYVRLTPTALTIVSSVEIKYFHFRLYQAYIMLLKISHYYQIVTKKYPLYFYLRIIIMLKIEMNHNILQKEQYKST